MVELSWTASIATTDKSLNLSHLHLLKTKFHGLIKIVTLENKVENETI